MQALTVSGAEIKNWLEDAQGESVVEEEKNQISKWETQQQYLLNRRYAYQIYNPLEINAFCIMQTAQWFSCWITSADLF